MRGFVVSGLVAALGRHAFDLIVQQPGPYFATTDPHLQQVRCAL